jgi:DNA-binding transcriptional regulator YdaS (Cro superfamily)
MLNHRLRNLHNHMDLRSYTENLPHGGMAELARRCGITPVYLSQLAAKQDGRVPSATLASVIERETGKSVTRQELRPDWKAIWPELKPLKTPAAPEQAAEAKAEA